MPYAFEHRVMAAVCVGGAAASDWNADDHWAKHPLVAAVAAAGCGTLPDVLEPALHPNHRQFFHSLLFASGVGFVLYKLYQWEPESEGGKLVRAAALVGGCAYLVHLAMDAFTPKSLPLVGKL
jgi:inner membrane protein